MITKDEPHATWFSKHYLKTPLLEKPLAKIQKKVELAAPLINKMSTIAAKYLQLQFPYES